MLRGKVQTYATKIGHQLCFFGRMSKTKSKKHTDPYHFVHNVMNCCFNDQGLLPHFCRTRIFSVLLVICDRLHKL